MVAGDSGAEETDRLLFKCVYCDKYRDETGSWKQMKTQDLLLQRNHTNYGICPRCFEKYFPEDVSSRYQEGLITIRKTITASNRITYDIFLSSAHPSIVGSG